MSDPRLRRPVGDWGRRSDPLPPAPFGFVYFEKFMNSRFSTKISIAVVIAAFGGLSLNAIDVYKRSTIIKWPFVQQAVQITNAHEQAMDALGRPLTVGMINHTCAIPVHGTDDNGTLYVAAKKYENVAQPSTAEEPEEKSFASALFDRVRNLTQSAAEEPPIDEWKKSPWRVAKLELFLESQQQRYTIYELWLLIVFIVQQLCILFPYAATLVQQLLIAVHNALLVMHPDYVQLLTYLAVPVIILLVLPLLLCLLVYVSALWLHMYKLRAQLKRAYATSMWDGARETIAASWDFMGWVWHGYEIEGLDNIPAEGNGLIVFYHGPLPTDMYFVLAKLLLHRKRMFSSVGDRFLQKIPGMRLLCEVFRITPGSVEQCVDVLDRGELLCVSPGGVREALFSDPKYYDCIWGERLGFARVALRAKCPIIPMFTENCRETFRVPQFGMNCLRRLYEKTRLPIALYYGGWPVKLRTYLGTPITYTEEQYLTLTPEMIRDDVRNRIDELIEQNQRLPGSVFMALLQRVYDCHKCNKNSDIHEGIITRRRASRIDGADAVPVQPVNQGDDDDDIVQDEEDTAPLATVSSASTIHSEHDEHPDAVVVDGAHGDDGVVVQVPREHCTSTDDSSSNANEMTRMLV